MAPMRIRVLLFLSSYFPLWLILGILFFSVSPIITVICGILGVSGLLGLWGYLHRSSKRNARQFMILHDYHSRDSESMSYIASYIVPFATFSLNGVAQILSLAIFLFVLLILYVQSNMIYINPMLNLIGYHLYEIEVERGERGHYYLARHRLVRGEPIHYVHISDEIWLEVKA